MTDEQVRILKEVVMAYFMEFAWREWGKSWKPSVKIPGIPAEIQTKYLLNTSYSITMAQTCLKHYMVMGLS